jgi:hypothetical protein
MSNFEDFLTDLEREYPKNTGNNIISTNFGRPMRLKLKSGQDFGVLWYRWEHQNNTDLKNQVICFNSGNRDIDKFKINFNQIAEIQWL